MLQPILLPLDRHEFLPKSSDCDLEHSESDMLECHFLLFVNSIPLFDILIYEQRLLPSKCRSLQGRVCYIDFSVLLYLGTCCLIYTRKHLRQWGRLQCSVED